MASAPGRNHTALGKYNARKTLEDDHRDNHHMDDREVYHHDARCTLCVAEHFASKANADGWPR